MARHDGAAPRGGRRTQAHVSVPSPGWGEEGRQRRQGANADGPVSDEAPARVRLDARVCGVRATRSCEFVFVVLLVVLFRVSVLRISCVCFLFALFVSFRLFWVDVVGLFCFV